MTRWYKTALAYSLCFILTSGLLQAQSVKIDLEALLKKNQKETQKPKKQPKLFRPFKVVKEQQQVFGSVAYTFKPDTIGHSYSIWHKNYKKDWPKANYVVIDLYNPNRYLVNVLLGFYTENKATGLLERTCFSSVGIMPHLRTKMVVPLEYLNCQNIYLPRFGRQFKGRIFGIAVDKSELADVRLELEPFDNKFFASTLWVNSIELQTQLDNKLPALNEPYINSNGQLVHKLWPSKIQGDEALRIEHKGLDTLFADALQPPMRNKWGGYKGLKLEGTGWFRVEQQKGGRWWLVDPDGYAFLSAGVTGIRSDETAMVTGFEELYEELPNEEQKELWRTKPDGTRFFSPVEWNLSRIYGRTEWKAKWLKLTKSMMLNWGFNTIANWSSPDFIGYADLPYVFPMKKFPYTKKMLYRDFPDVYDPSYKDSAVKFAQQLLPLKNDRNLIGYFLNNEPEWAFGDNNLGLQMLRTRSGPNYTRRELKDQLINQFKGDIKGFNNAWGLKLKSFDQLDTLVLTNQMRLTKDAEAYLKEFSYTMLDKYLKPVCNAVKEVDPFHLNLGIRYAWISNDLCYKAGQYFDVFSVNGYNYPGPPETATITAKTGRPVMIGEFHFGAVDQGPAATGIVGVQDQVQRGIAYQYYVEQGFARPEVVGIHYFMWNDQAIGGRFDGENYNIGLVDVGNRPYWDFVNYVKDANYRIYDVAKKLYPPATIKAKKAPDIY